MHAPRCMTVTRFFAEANDGSSSVDFVEISSEEGFTFQIPYEAAEILFGVKLERGESKDLTCGAWYPFHHQDETLA